MANTSSHVKPTFAMVVLEAGGGLVAVRASSSSWSETPLLYVTSLALILIYSKVV